MKKLFSRIRSSGRGPNTGGELIIYGSPTTSAVNGDAFSFQALTTYAYGHSLTYSMTGLTGVTIDASTGLATGTLTTGVYNPSITVTNSAGNTSTLSFWLTVVAAAAANNVPTITTGTQTSVVSAARFYSVFYAEDVDGDSLTFSVTGTVTSWPNYQATQIVNSAGYSELSIFSSASPTVGVDTNYTLNVTVSDGTDTASTGNQTITVTASAPVNTLPTLVTTTLPASTAMVGVPYSYTVQATDPDLPTDELVYSVSGNPIGSSINSTTGVFSWTPTSGQTGATGTITFQVHDGHGYAVTPITVNITVAAASTKFAAGHWMALKGRSLNTGHSLPPLTGSLRDPSVHFAKNYVQGFIARWDWNEIEAVKNTYTLTTGQNSIQAWLDALAAVTTATYIPKLIVLPVVKAFSSDNRANPLPAYMVDFTVPYLSDATKKTLQRWKYNTGDTNDPTTRLIALATAIGNQFDSHANFGGIAWQETAIGITSANLTAGGYTAAAYIEAITLLNVGTRAALPTSEAYCFTNFIENTPGASDGNTNLKALFADTRNQTNNIIMGGPDIVPNRASLTKVFYPLFDTWKNQYRTFCSNQNDSFQALKNDGVTYYTMDEMWQFAKDDLSCEMVFTNAEAPVAALSAAYPNGPTWGNTASPGDGGSEEVMKKHRTWTPGSLTLLNENFMGTAAASISGRVSSTGSIACVLSGTGGFVIGSNLHSAVVSDTTLAARASWTLPSVPGTIEWSFKNPYTGTQADSRAIMFFRRVSSNNEWRVRLVSQFTAGVPTSTVLQIGFLNGTTTFVNAAAPVTMSATLATSDSFYKLTDDGVTIKVWVDGVLIFTLTDASISTYTSGVHTLAVSTIQVAGAIIGALQGANSLTTFNSLSAAA